MPDKNSKESLFFFIFGRDPLVPLNSILKPTVRYLGIDENILAFEALKKMYHLVITNLDLA